MKKSIAMFLCGVCVLSMVGCGTANKTESKISEEVVVVSTEKEESSVETEKQEEQESEPETSEKTENETKEESDLTEQITVVATLFEGMINRDKSAVESCFYEKDSNFDTNVSSNLAIGDSIRENTEIVYEAISGYDEAPLDEDRDALYKKAFPTSETVRFTANIPMYQVVDIEGVPCMCEVSDIYEVEMFCVDGTWYIGLLNEIEAKLIDYAPIAE